VRGVEAEENLRAGVVAAQLKELSQFVDEIANLRHNPRQPWVGSAAFAHKGGTHVNAVQKLTSSYEHIDPALVGNARNVLISDLAGRSNIVMKAQELGFKRTNDTPELKPILNRIKELEHAGYEFEAAEASLALLIGKTLKHREPLFTWMPITFPCAAMAWNPSAMRRSKSALATSARKRWPKATAGERARRRVARRAGEVYPQLKKVTLTDYKVRILDSDTGTAAKTRVLIESSDGRRDWGTVGVSENIIEASLQALVDSMEFALLRR